MALGVSELAHLELKLCGPILIIYKQNLLYPVAHSRTLARTHLIRPSLTQTH